MEMDRGQIILLFHRKSFPRENGNMKMEINPFQNGNELHSAGLVVKWKLQNGFISILQNGNGNRKMEMNPFQNGNEMDSAGREAKMEIAKWKWFHFAKWKWECEMEVGSRNFHFHSENGIKMDLCAPP